MADVDPGIVGAEPPEGFQVDIRTNGFTLTEAIRTYANQHIGAKLAKHARAIQAVTIRFADVNGPKGGADKRCAIEVFIRRGNPIIVEEMDDDLHAAMDKAADRADVAVARELARTRDLRRQRGGKIARDQKMMH